MGSVKRRASVPVNNVEPMACRRCGVCCTWHQALATPAEIKRIAAYLGMSLNEWENLYDDKRWWYTEDHLIRHVNGVCAFLKFSEGLATCLVHAVKPACCEAWQPGTEKKECREGMEQKRGQPPK